MSHCPDHPGSSNAEDSLITIASPAPQFAEQEIRQLLREQYGLEGDLKSLVSERDQNIWVTTSTGQQFVLKIANATEDPDVTDFQIKALIHMRGSAGGINVPKIILTQQGNVATQIAGAHTGHVARLVSYVPGIPYADVAPSVECSQSLGRCLANLGIALRDFEHAGDRQVLLWDMQRASDLRGLIRHVAEADLQAAICRCMDDFEQNAQPRFNCLRTQVIHSDLNPANALVNPDDHSRVTGAIDFGDMIRAPLIMDVAIAASYLRSEDDDLLAFIAPFVAAYHRIRPLEHVEFELLYDLIRTRLITTITILRWRLSVRGKNDAYSQEVLQNERDAERFFLRLNALSAEGFAEQIRQACNR